MRKAFSTFITCLCLVVLSGAALGDTCPWPAQAVGEPQVRRGHEIRFRQRIETITRALRGERFDVLLLGDSLVQQWPQDSVELAFPNRRVLNAGVSGDTTLALMFRLSSIPTPAVVEGKRVEIGVRGWELQKPEIVLVLLGTNDLRRSPPCDIVANLAAVAKRIKELWAETQVHVLSILPRGADQNEYAEEIARVNSSLDRIAKLEPGLFHFVNLHDSLLCRGQVSCELRRPPNYVHLTPDGYSQLVDALRRQLRVSEP